MAYLDPLRLRQFQSLANLNDVTLTHLAEGACGAVENFCGRTFALTSHDELYQGTNSRSLFLNNYPVTSIKSVRSGRQIAVQIQNNTANIQAAQVQTTATALILKIINGGTETPVTLTYADHPTLGSLTTAINGIGNGWYASLNGQFATWASADLAAYPTTQNARQNVASLSPHYWYLSNYELNPKTGELTMPGCWCGSGLWPYRITYEAGFDPVPEELLQATAELAASTHKAGKADPNLVSESLGGYSYTRAATKSIADLSIQSQQTLRHYRRPRIPFFGVGGVR